MGGLRWRSPASTESDMREQSKRTIRSAGYFDRHVIVHRSADRGAPRSEPRARLSARVRGGRNLRCAFGCCERSCVRLRCMCFSPLDSVS